MKVAYLAKSKIPSNTANSVHVMKMCESFSNSGADITLFGPKSHLGNTTEIFEFYGVENNKFNIVFSEVFGGRVLGFFLYGIKVIAAMKGKDFDLIFGRDLRTIFLTALFFLKIPIVYESHQPYLKYNIMDRGVIWLLIKLGRLKKIIVISDALKSIYKSKSLFASVHIEVLHDAANPNFSRRIELPELCVGEGIRVGYTGHLYPGRGIDVIVQLASLRPRDSFYVIGGSEEDVKYWKNKADLPNLAFLGFVKPKEVGGYLLEFDVLLAPYQKSVSIKGVGDTGAYMSPLKIFEYMASGKAIIVSDHAVLKEVLSSAEARFASASNIGEWLESLLFFEDKNNRKTFGKRARSKYMNLHTWDIRAAKVLKLVEEEVKQVV